MEFVFIFSPPKTLHGLPGTDLQYFVSPFISMSKMMLAKWGSSTYIFQGNLMLTVHTVGRYENITFSKTYSTKVILGGCHKKKQLL